MARPLHRPVEHPLVNFYQSKRFWSGVVAGVMISFLFAQPFLLLGFHGLKQLLLGILPHGLVEFLWSHTLISLLFLWFLVPLAAGYWFYRGEYLKHEDVPGVESAENPPPYESDWKTWSENEDVEPTRFPENRFE